MNKSPMFKLLLLKAVLLALLLGAAGRAQATTCTSSVYFTTRESPALGTFTQNGSVLNIKTSTGTIANSIGVLKGWMNIDLFQIFTPSGGDSCFVSTWRENTNFNVGNIAVHVHDRAELIGNCGTWIGLPGGNYKENARFNNLSWIWEAWNCPRMQLRLPVDITIENSTVVHNVTLDLFNQYKVSAGERSRNLNGQVLFQRRGDLPSILNIQTPIPTCSLSVPSQVTMPRVPTIVQTTTGVVNASKRDIPITLNCNNNTGVRRNLSVRLIDANSNAFTCQMANTATSSPSRARISLFTDTTMQTPVCFNQQNFDIPFNAIDNKFNGSQTRTISAAYNIPAQAAGTTVFGNVQSTLVLSVIYP
jgi:hypothetical protein